jgi:pectinesterase
MKKNLLAGLLAAIFCTANLTAQAAVKIILVGDSTVTDNAGWGLGFKQFLVPEKTELINTARGGRSSESFRREGLWTNALALHGDYYLIQFGHNNEPGKPGRSTDMATFVSNMVSYVEEARSIGAKPVLVTPLTRRQWDKEHPGKIKSSLAPYAEEVRKIAAEKNVPLVDLQARSIELCESLGPEKCLEFSPTKTNADGAAAFDGTHLNTNGYVLFARLVADELRKAAPELAPVLRAEPLEKFPAVKNAKADDASSVDDSAARKKKRTPAGVKNSADAPQKKILIVLVGDSTVNDGGGWGFGFKQFLTPDVACSNLAANGRSSKSFIAEGRWQKALDLKGDYYFIQFGHNDEPGKGPDRETDPATTYTQNLNRYVDESRAIGGKPVLVTSLTRRMFDDTDKLKPSLVPYTEAVKKVAAAKNVPLVDLHDRSVEFCSQLGPVETAKFNPVGKDGKQDTTHLNAKGRVAFARLVVAEVRQAVPELAPHLLAEPNAAAVSEKHYDAVVSFDGAGNFTTVQEAIAAAPENPAKPFTILIKPAKYEGQIIVPKGKRIHLIGEETENTVLTYGLNVNETNAKTDLRFKGTGVIVLGDDFSAKNITFENTSGDHGQALALRVDGDRAAFEHCRLLGWQDTLMINNGRDYFTNCYVAGRVDFIYGSAAAVFDRCEIHSKNGGHVTAANTPADKPFGFVFLDCKLTGDTNPWVAPDGVPANTKSKPLADLGRPWRPYASVAYVRCEMGAHILPAGWNNWRNPTNELTARFAEYQSTGPGANPDQRVKWAKQLTGDEAKNLTVEKILGGADGWHPAVD